MIKRYSFLFLFLLVECSTSYIPTQESSVNHTPPDTIIVRRVEPIPFTGEETQPISVSIDTSASPQPSQQVRGVEVDSEQETITIQSQSGDSTLTEVFNLPEYGEQLQLLSDTVGFVGRVAGEPKAEQVDVVTHSPFNNVKKIVFAVVLLVVISLVFRLTTK